MTPRGIVWMEGLGKMKESNDLIRILKIIISCGINTLACMCRAM
jgi:hypothetical protein